MFDAWTVMIIASIGLAAGVLGGMLGIGGSLLMIPALVTLFGQDRTPGFNQHLYQAAAMIVNVAIAVPATVRHMQARAVLMSVFRVMLPAAIVAIVIGVWLSDRPVFRSSGPMELNGPVLLGRVLVIFMVYVIVVNVWRMFRKPRPVDQPIDPTHITVLRSSVVGLMMGLIAGLLGVGGGALAVPMQQTILKLPLRYCIANSAAVMCLSSPLGAGFKNASLATHGLAWTDSVILAALLAPTAILGGYLGGWLTHVLPIRLVRGVFIVVLILAAYKMAAV